VGARVDADEPASGVGGGGEVGGAEGGAIAVDVAAAGRSSCVRPSVNAPAIAPTTATAASTYVPLPFAEGAEDFLAAKLGPVDVEPGTGVLSGGRGTDEMAGTVSASGEMTGGGSEPP